MSEEAAPVLGGAPAAVTTETATQQTATQQQGSWLETLPEPYRADKNLTKYQSMEDFVKGHISLASKVGAPSVLIPQDGWTDTQWDEFHSKLGRPAKPDEYSIERPQLPEGVEYDEDLEKGFKDWAHKAGLSPRQAKNLFENYTKYSLERGQKMGESSAQAAQARAQQDADGVKGLQQEWGDKYEAKISGANHALKTLDPNGEVVNILRESGLANNPAMIKLFAQVGETFAEDTFRGGSTFKASMTGAKAPAEALAEIGHLKTDTAFQKALMNKSEPGHAEVVARWNALHQAAYPEPQKS